MGTRSFPYAGELNIVSDANDHSTLLVNVYRKRSFKRNALLGRLTDTIGGVLGKLKDGGTKILCITCSTDPNSSIKVLEDALRSPNGSKLSGITIKFALTAEPRGDGNADECRAPDTVTRATAVDPLSSTPAAVGLLSSAIDTGTNVITEVQTFETTWGVLLQRMELFNKIVDGFAQVFDVQCLDSLTIRMPYRFTRIRRWLGPLYQLRTGSVCCSTSV